MFPFATRVAENFAKKTGKKAPKVESLGTGGGIKLFCSGTGEGGAGHRHRLAPMKKSEFDACAAKGVKDIIQIKVGFDGIVVATDKDGADYNFKPEHLYLGLSKKVLRQGKFVANPYKTWDEIGSGLPGNRINGLRPAAHLGHPRRLRGTRHRGRRPQVPDRRRPALEQREEVQGAGRPAAQRRLDRRRRERQRHRPAP